MAYMVKEIFYTLQGEGANSGRPAVFCRFAGCNLWSGREEDRAEAQCRFCDTDFVGIDGPDGGAFATAQDLVVAVAALWPDQQAGGVPLVVCTGGEPLLQLDDDLIDAFHGAGFQIAVESNGTIAAPAEIDWLCVSPKAGTKLVQKSGNELKLVYPQAHLDPAQFAALEFDNFFIQPLDEGGPTSHMDAAVAYCLAHPRWRISLQSHKFLGIA